MSTLAVTVFNSNSMADPTAVVELWTGLTGSPFFQAPKIGDLTNHGNGEYSIDVPDGTGPVTVVVDGVASLSRRNITIGSGATVSDGTLNLAKMDHLQLVDQVFTDFSDDLLIDITAGGFTNPKVLQLTFKSEWQATFKSISATELRLTPDAFGSGDEIKFDVIIVES
jgi:hypothetical protein